MPSGSILMARMCGYRQMDATMCVDNPSATCTDQTFVFGVDSEVIGVLDQSK